MLKLHDLVSFAQEKPTLIALGSHPGILQSIMDFDYLSGHERPTLAAVISGSGRTQRFFWGSEEVVVPVYPDIDSVPSKLAKQVNCALSLVSGRRTYSTLAAACAKFSGLKVVNIFAEGLPEYDALELLALASARGVQLVGPASVGLLLPGVLKLGAIGGTQLEQLLVAGLRTKGKVAVVAASGGMTNELINLAANSGAGVSAALSVGGDRYPGTSAVEAVAQLAQLPETKVILYYGELGGQDEYELAAAIEAGRIKKPVIAYISGVVGEMFAEAPQFGHAKAIAGSKAETASAKRKALKTAGVKVAQTFAEVEKLLAGYVKTGKSGKIKELGKTETQMADNSETPGAYNLTPVDRELADSLSKRRSKLFLSRISGDIDGDAIILGKDLTKLTSEFSYGRLVISLLLGQEVKSKLLSEFTELVWKLFVDHGPYVSGAVNTMIGARAGKDLVSSLASGLLTIGPRFGGAIGEAAGNWLAGVQKGSDPYEFVEGFAARKVLIAGIGHRKYRLDLPDPRVELITSYAAKLKRRPHLDFAVAVSKVTMRKKANLILNVDGAVAAVLLDLLQQELGYTAEQLQELCTIDFFTAFFALPRALGFTAHYLDQRRLDEGLFRLGPDEVGYSPN